jgi:DNA gyrase/topoisomerase IV subunit A
MAMTERQYDLINNEGGEGYNPIREAREREEHEAMQAYYQTREGRKEAIIRMLERKDCSLAKECGTYDQAEIDDLNAQLAAIEAEELAEFTAIWTLDVTVERREAWNARVRAGEFTVDGRVDPRKLGLVEREQGWSFMDLKKAIKNHNL